MKIYDINVLKLTKIIFNNTLNIIFFDNKTLQ